MDGVLVAFVGVVVGALIGWLVSLDADRRATARERDFRTEDRRNAEEALRRALGEELRANARLLKQAIETRRFAPVQTAAWVSAIGVPFHQQQSREFLQDAYINALQYNEAVRAMPPRGTGNVFAEQGNLCADLAKAALSATEEAERLYVGNREDPAHPQRIPTGIRKA